MTNYLITLILLNSCIQARVRSDKPHQAICALIEKIGRPAEAVMGVICKREKP